MSEFTLDTEVSAQKCGGQLCDQFLCRILPGAEATLHVSVEAALVAAPMSQFVKHGRKVVLTAGEGLLRGQRDEVLRRDVARPIAADPDVGHGRVDEQRCSVLSRFRFGYGGRIGR